MIICICSNVSEKQIKDLLPASVEEVIERTNCAMQCGSCFQEVIDIVENFGGSDWDPAGPCKSCD